MNPLLYVTVWTFELGFFSDVINVVEKLLNEKASIAKETMFEKLFHQNCFELYIFQ